MELNGAKVTPLVSTKWVKCSVADTKFNKNGVFSIDVILDPNNPAHDAFMEEISDLCEKAHEALGAENPKIKKYKLRSPIKPEEDSEGEETGNMIIKFKQNKVMESKRTGKTYTIKHIPVFDAKRNPVATSVQIGNGSEGKVKFETRSYSSAKDREVGITMDLKAFQLLKLNEFGGDSGAAEGFGEEDGWEDDSPSAGFNDEGSSSAAVPTDEHEDF